MVATQTLIIGAAALAFLIPERTAAAGGAAGEFGVGIARGITALGTIKISPEFAPNISPRVVPEFGIRTDFPEWLDPREIWGLEKIFKGDDPEVVEVVDVGQQQDEHVKEAERQKEREAKERAAEAEEAEDVEVDPDPKGIGLIEG